MRLLVVNRVRALFKLYLLVTIMMVTVSGISFATYAWQVRHSPFFEKLMADTKSFECIGEVLDKKRPKFIGIHALSIAYRDSIGAKLSPGATLGSVLNELAIRAAFTRTEINRMTAASYSPTQAPKFDAFSLAFFGAHYCALALEQQDIVLAYERSRSLKLLRPKIEALREPQPLAELERLERREAEYRTRSADDPKVSAQ